MKNWKQLFNVTVIKKVLLTDINHAHLSTQDCMILATLLSFNYSFDDAYLMIRDSKNEKILHQVQAKLQKGILIEQALYPVLPKQYKAPFSCFIEVMSLDQCLKRCEEFLDISKQMKNYWIKQVVPSLILVIISFVGLILFKVYGIELMDNLTKSFHQELTWLHPLDTFLLITIIGLTFIFMGIVAFFIAIRFKKVNQYLIQFGNKQVKANIFVLKSSYDFANYFKACLTSGLKTIEILTILQKSQNYFVSMSAQLIIHQLEKGKPFEQALNIPLLDTNLIKFIQLSMYSNTTHAALTSYCIACNGLIEKKIRQLSTTIQVICYGFIGLLIVCIYQVLFLPMQIISSL